MTTDEKRAIAALATMPGYALMVQTLRDETRRVLDILRLTDDQGKILNAAVELRLLDRLTEQFDKRPREMIAELKKEGDAIYG
jgi:DNA-binding MarR family transcriptional regulator